MNSSFTLAIAILLSLAFILMVDEIKTEEQPKYNNTVVVEKGKNIFIGYYLYLKFEPDSIVLQPVYQNFHDKYNVGDTVKTNLN